MFCYILSSSVQHAPYNIQDDMRHTMAAYTMQHTQTHTPRRFSVWEHAPWICFIYTIYRRQFYQFRT